MSTTYFPPNKTIERPLFSIKSRETIPLNLKSNVIWKYFELFIYAKKPSAALPSHVRLSL
jgi:hypothetical protein